MKLLLADDELAIREALSAAFKAAGWEVAAFNDGQSALENLPRVQPDLVILDVTMPRLNGWEVCRELKKNEQTKKIPVIILTGRTKGEDELMTAEAGADLYLTKPFDPLQVVEQARQLRGGGS